MLLREALDAGADCPPARLFCRQHGVSSRTYTLARKRLQAGAVSELPGRGPRPLFGELADALAEEIRSGHFGGTGALPSPKELANVFGVHPVTVRRALAELLERGILERLGRGFRVARLERGPSIAPPVLLCVGGGHQGAGLSMDSDREIDTWREVQAEAASHGLAVRMVPWNGSLGRIPSGTMGAVVSTWHLPDPQALLDELVERRIRSCVWTGTALDRADRDWEGKRLLSFHDIGDARAAGRDMARFLDGLGHRRIAWISPFHGSRWSRNRLAGVRSGFPGIVDPFVLEAVSESDFMEPIQETLAKWTGLLGDLEGWSLSPVHFLWEPFKAKAMENLVEALRPRLEQAVSGGATAWICASDLVAGLCRRWLARRGVSVPEEVSVCGFDDTAMAMREDTTSYRFDSASMARSMVRSILSGAPGGTRRTSHPGRVVVRSSTAPPRQDA